MTPDNARILADTLHDVLGQMERVRLHLRATEEQQEYQRAVVQFSYIATAITVALRTLLAEHADIREASLAEAERRQQLIPTPQPGQSRAAAQTLQNLAIRLVRNPSPADFTEAESFLRQSALDEHTARLVFRLTLGAALRAGDISERLIHTMLDVAEIRSEFLEEPEAEQLELLLRKLMRSDDANRLRGLRRSQSRVQSPEMPTSPIALLTRLVTSAEWLFGDEARRAVELEEAVSRAVSALEDPTTRLSVTDAESLSFASTSYAHMLKEPARLRLAGALGRHIERSQQLLVLTQRWLADFATS